MSNNRDIELASGLVIGIGIFIIVMGILVVLPIGLVATIDHHQNQSSQAERSAVEFPEGSIVNLKIDPSKTKYMVIVSQWGTTKVRIRKSDGSALSVYPFELVKAEGD